MASRTAFWVLAVSSMVLMVSAATIPPNKVAAKVPKKVCDVCACTADTINCSNRNLTTNLEDHQWPQTPIKFVTFENNSITHIRPFPNGTVVKLSFCHNKIERIDPHSFKTLKNLTELDLSHNLLNYENLMPYALEGPFRPEAYEPLGNLTVLDLSFNQLHSLNRDLFEHVRDLKVLILAGNPFGTFDSAATVSFTDIPFLRELDLSRCNLEKLDENTLHTTRYLKKLDLSWNKFVVLPAALHQSPSLESLILDGNPIEMLGPENAFPELPKLKELSMRNMSQLLAIDKGSMSNLPNLEILKIENCWQLKEISDSALVRHPKDRAATWPPLKTLNITNNALRYLPATLVARWDKLEHLHLTGNDWSCDCENQHFIGTLLVQQGTRLMGNDTRSLRCASPPEHLNETLLSLSHRQLRCLDRYGAQPERDAAILVGLLVGVLLAIPCALGFIVLYRRGFFFCGAQGPASFSRAFYKRAPPYDGDM